MQFAFGAVIILPSGLLNSRANQNMYSKIRNFKLGNTISGVLLMVLHAASMAALYIAAKNLMHDIPPKQVAFLYKFSILIAVIPWCMKGGFINNLRTTRLGVHITRGTFSVLGSLCFFYGLSKVEAMDAAAVAYLENALVLTAGVLYFKERLTFAKVVLITFGVVGVLFVIKPGFQEFNNHYIYLFLALVFWAINNVAIKILGKTERTKPQLFYTMLVGSILSFPLALKVWQPLEFAHLKYIAFLSIFHIIHVVALFKAFKFADVSIVMPFDYLRLIFTGVLGFMFLGEVPDKYSIIGYCLIIFGGLYLIQSEAKKKGFTQESERKALAIEEVHRKRRERIKMKKKMAKIEKDK